MPDAFANNSPVEIILANGHATRFTRREPTTRAGSQTSPVNTDWIRPKQLATAA